MKTKKIKAMLPFEDRLANSLQRAVLSPVGQPGQRRVERRYSNSEYPGGALTSGGVGIFILAVPISNC